MIRDGFSLGPRVAKIMTNDPLDDIVGKCHLCGEEIAFRQSHVVSGVTGEVWHLVCHEKKSRQPAGLKINNVTAKVIKKEEV